MEPKKNLKRTKGDLLYRLHYEDITPEQKKEIRQTLNVIQQMLTEMEEMENG
jgi:hypothetical protein